MNRNLAELYPCQTCGHPNYKHDGNEQGNEDQSCNHYDIIEPKRFLWANRRVVTNRIFCVCQAFKADNLRYLEQKANG